MNYTLPNDEQFVDYLSEQILADALELEMENRYRDIPEGMDPLEWIEIINSKNWSEVDETFYNAASSGKLPEGWHPLNTLSKHFEIRFGVEDATAALVCDLRAINSLKGGQVAEKLARLIFTVDDERIIRHKMFNDRAELRFIEPIPLHVLTDDMKKDILGTLQILVRS